LPSCAVYERVDYLQSSETYQQPFSSQKVACAWVVMNLHKSVPSESY
jgi:hypothetical protein